MRFKPITHEKTIELGFDFRIQPQDTGLYEKGQVRVRFAWLYGEMKTVLIQKKTEDEWYNIVASIRIGNHVLGESWSWKWLPPTLAKPDNYIPILE